MMDLQYTVTPVEGKDVIGYQLTGPGVDEVCQVLGTRIAQLGDQIVRAQLIAAGWTPPGEPTAIERKDVLLRRVLEAIESHKDTRWECNSDHPKLQAAMVAIKEELQ